MPPKFASRLGQAAARASQWAEVAQLPPHDDALEAAVLGAALLEASATQTVLAVLRGNPQVFYRPAHALVFQALMAQQAAGEAIDLLTVVARLRTAGTLAAAGGAHFVGTLMNKVNSSTHLNTHCQVLLELYTKRRIAELSQQLRACSLDPTADSHGLLGEAQLVLNGLHETLQARHPRPVGAAYDEAVDRIVAATRAPAGITGVPTGLWALDKITGGWQPGNLIIVAARPGMGKTSLLLATGRQSAGQGRPGYLASLEMSEAELVTKLIATELGYTTSQLTRGVGLSLAEAEHIRERAQVLRAVGLVLDDTPGLSIGELRAKAAKAKQEHDISWVGVDYLQLMRGDRANGGNREQEISSISRGLKLIAKELHLPVIAAAQLSRATETRGGDKKPQLSDLRESGSIEQDADVVIFPYRPEYYKIMEDEMGNSTANVTELLIAKHRNGSLGTAVVGSDMSTGRYWDLTADEPFQPPSPAPPRQLPASDFDKPF